MFFSGRIQNDFDFIMLIRAGNEKKCVTKKRRSDDKRRDGPPYLTVFLKNFQETLYFELILRLIRVCVCVTVVYENRQTMRATLHSSHN